MVMKKVIKIVRVEIEECWPAGNNDLIMPSDRVKVGDGAGCWRNYFDYSLCIRQKSFGEIESMWRAEVCSGENSQFVQHKVYIQYRMLP